MKKLIKDIKAAATVFVTLLIIPAILVSGTAVDLARMHTVRSITHDANQLAANSVLAHYDALLHDLYGIFGVNAEHPTLVALVNDYIEISIFGSSRSSSELGTLHVFYGSDLEPASVIAAEDKNLQNAEVLKRQIDEYMKFRGPIILVQELMDLLSKSTIQEDSAVIGEKVLIEAGIGDLFELYRRLHTAIERADRCNQAIGGIAGGSFGNLSRILVEAQEQFVELRRVYNAWANALNEATKAERAMHYYAILSNIRSLMLGGQRGSDWALTHWETIGRINVGLNETVIRAKQQAHAFKVNFDDVLNIAIEIESMRHALIAQVNDLEHNLRTGNVDPQLRNALLRPTEGGKSQLELYREILSWENVDIMAREYRNAGYSYIDDHVIPLIDSVEYRNIFSPFTTLSREELASLASHPSFDLESRSPNRAGFFAGFPADSVVYKIPPGFLRFSAISIEHAEFFAELSEAVSTRNVEAVRILTDSGNTASGRGESGQRSIITELFGIIQEAFSGLTNTPLGASHINSTTSTEHSMPNIMSIHSEITYISRSPIMGVISDPAGSAAQVADYLLLLAYGTSMFSNYTTGRPENNNATRENMHDFNYSTSLTGVPISPEVNYFFQSEWEYLFNGSDNANSNLNAITRLLFLTRLICNYITVFAVVEISAVVNTIRAAFAWSKPLALILSELARAAFVTAESLMDVANLRSGNSVSLVKRHTEWKCTPGNTLTMLSSIRLGKLSGSSTASNTGLNYSNYMVLFFVADALFSKDATDRLATQIGSLIEINMNNYMNLIYSDEEKMRVIWQNEDRFKLSEMVTDFTVSFTVNMRMLFLSIPFAQRGINGIIPPLGFPVTTIDHRGY